MILCRHMIAIALIACVGVTMAQERTGRQGRGRFDPEQMRQRIAERMKEMLGATDEEWAVIGPRLEKVQALAREAGGGTRGLFGFRRRGGEEGEEEAEEPESEMEKATAALRAVLDEQTSTATQIRASLTAYRAAREKARQELAKGQAQLREVLSMRQEAQLVLIGTLD